VDEEPQDQAVFGGVHQVGTVLALIETLK